MLARSWQRFLKAFWSRRPRVRRAGRRPLPARPCLEALEDRTLPATGLASIGTSGAQGNGVSSSASVSADGRYVAFYSQATNLVPGDTNGTFDVFVRDLLTNTTTRVSVD